MEFTGQAVGCPVAPRRFWQALPFPWIALSHGLSHGTPERPSAVQDSHRHLSPGRRTGKVPGGQTSPRSLPKGILLATQIRRRDPLPRCQVGRGHVLICSAAWSAGSHRSRRQSPRAVALVWGGIMAAAGQGVGCGIGMAPSRVAGPRGNAPDPFGTRDRAGRPGSTGGSPIWLP
jgi:hypothetical protein